MLRSLSFSFLVIAALMAQARAASDADREAQKALKGLVGAIRYGKDAAATKRLAFDVMAEELLAEKWQELGAAEKTEVINGLAAIVSALSFPKGRELFQYLDATLFEPVRLEGDRARIKSTFVVHRKLKKMEVVIEWVLVKQGASFRVLDTIMLGESTLASIRNEQVVPLLEKGGTKAVLEALRARVAALEKA